VLDKLENKKPKPKPPPHFFHPHFFSIGPGFSRVGDSFFVGFSTTTSYITSFGNDEDLLNEGVNFWRTVRLRSFVLC
jgi:hypothetical protein